MTPRRILTGLALTALVAAPSAAMATHTATHSYRQSYDTIIILPDGTRVGIIDERPSTATYGAPPTGTTCSPGRVEDVPEKYRALYIDGATYGPAYAGQRCLTTR